MGRDASIIIQEVKFSYNGTFVCQVKNPPDVHGPSGEIRLRVVTTGLPPHSKRNSVIITLTRSWNVAVFPCHLLISSLVLRSSPAGVGYRRGHHRRGAVPHHRRVLQAVQEEETKAARKMRGGPPQREKRPYSVVRVRGDGRGGGSVAHFFSHSHFNSGDEGRCSSFSGPRGWFLSCWIHHFNFPQLHPLDLKSGPPDGHLPLSRAQLRIVESCRKM